ncbi:hypothetical protein DM02DRAFT_535608 [Periconia macrospinosa]|uniref:Xylanolytic transcriptional activator regulatory domain-containing protein n=1 Tax=Periconia macrospinosa TaxID=97972 RepID=A0A2V1DGG6_9PLEO|nr:hypothetical protein DM02DRAFT_535608 [Periconia macrospinosa]
MWLPAGFDVAALDDSISTSILEWGSVNASTSYGSDQRHDDRDFHLRNNGAGAPGQSASNVQQDLSTSILGPESPLDSISTVSSSHQDLLDDKYREDLSHRLRPPINDHSLPSADFLNLCIKLYFTKFNPVFPIIHAPSFRPSSENALHLLSICSLGALFVGSASAAAQGRKIFHTLNKGILACSENYLNHGSRKVLSIVQAAAIGQTFGMLSGLQSDLLMTESYHGSIIAWARHGGFFKHKQSLSTVTLSDTSNLEQTWKDWVHAEESVRIVAGLQIHDAEFAIAFQHEPLLRHAPNKISPCCADDLFAATTAEQWLACLRKTQRVNSFANIDPSLQPVASSPDHNRSHMFAYAALAGIVASIQEMRCSLLEASSIEYFRSSLLTWHRDYALAFPGEKHDSANLMVLWHEAFMALYADFNQLENLIDRDRDPRSGRIGARTTIWSNSSEGRRSVLHALFIVKRLETLPVGAEIAIHVPRALFYSTIIIFNYMKTAATADMNIQLSPEDIELPEIQVSQPSVATAVENERASLTRLGSIDASLLCHIIDLLRRIGHWEVSRRYAGVLEGLLEDFAKQ